MKRLPRGLAPTLVAALLAACDSPAPSGRGTVTARVLSPHRDDGAAVVEFAGRVRDVRDVGGAWALAQEEDGVTRVVVAAPPGSELSFRVEVDDVGAPPQARVLEAADAQNRLRESLAGYRVELRR